MPTISRSIGSSCDIEVRFGTSKPQIYIGMDLHMNGLDAPAMIDSRKQLQQLIEALNNFANEIKLE